MKKVLIIGVSGQDGSYLSQHILSKKKYQVYGIVRKKNNKNLNKLKLIKKIKLINIKRLNEVNLKKILNINFEIIYFCGGQSNIQESFTKKESETYDSQIKPLVVILEHIRLKNKKTKLVNFSSAEIFGDHKKKKIQENDLKKPLSPYALAKLAGFQIVKSYREMFNLKLFNIIFFNHESPLRNEKFVIKKVINSVKRIKNKTDKIFLGNINVKRDWGWAPEYMAGCLKISKSNKYGDYIIATGQSNSLRSVIRKILSKKNLNFKDHIRFKSKNLRKLNIRENYANINKIKKVFNWKPIKGIDSIIDEIYQEKVS